MYAAHKKHWLQKANEEMEKKGTKGSLTRAAHAAGYPSALEYAHHEEADPHASAKMKKKAQFAINANK